MPDWLLTTPVERARARRGGWVILAVTVLYSITSDEAIMLRLALVIYVANWLLTEYQLEAEARRS